jgi:hypothetical protein
MTENESDFVLEGNAVAGLLQEILALEITTTQIECHACDSVGAVGSLRLYAAWESFTVSELRRSPHHSSSNTAWSLARDDGRSPPEILGAGSARPAGAL